MTGRRRPATGRSGATRAVLATLCAAGIGLLGACGSSDDSGQAASGPSSSATAPTSSSSAAGSSTASAADVVIHIMDFGYQAPTSVSPGATVSVMNMDGEAHTVTADEGGAFDVQVPGDATVSFTAPMTPGTYAFHCNYHGNMHGVLVVG